MKIIEIPIQQLVLDRQNARKHSRKNIDAIKNSLRKFGQRKNIVIGKNNVVYAGNGTVLAAKELGWKTIFAVDASDLTPQQLKLFAIADNRTAELADWDVDVLAKEFDTIPEVDLNEIGFSMEDIIKLLGTNENETDVETEEENEEKSYWIEVYPFNNEERKKILAFLKTYQYKFKEQGE